MKIYLAGLLALYALLFSTKELAAQTIPFGPGFRADECEEILRLSLAFTHKEDSPFFTALTQDYQSYFRSESVGLDNAGDIWIDQDSTVYIIFRGTTANKASILADFYCAMVPAQGSVMLNNEKKFHYSLARDPKAAVHAGFLIGFAFVADNLEPQLDKLYEQGYRHFMVGGHSQGGALCYYMSAWLMQLKLDGTFPDIQVKTYASASPKMGNMYFAYDYDNITQSQWTFSIVNTADPIPEMPFTTQQVDIDMNEPNPILNLMNHVNDLPLLQRFVLKRSFNSMQNKARKSSQAYQKYLGKYVGKFIQESIPEVSIPDAVATTYFVRPGVPIVLSDNTNYTDFYQDAQAYFHHGIDPYRYLLRQYYDGLPVFAPLALKGK